MATADQVGDELAGSPKSASLFGSLWAVWTRKRRRDRVRSRSHVRFRLTREGVHFIGILIFIFVGAVMRDINLLILLAGVMIGLLLLQWRFNTSTLVGVRLERNLHVSATVEQETEVGLRLSNPKRMLSAWLVLVEDPIRKLQPTNRRLSEKGTALVDTVRPNGTANCRYRLVFHQRGKYRIGPSTLSTRFPLGLGRSWRTLDNESEILVRPRLGDLTSNVDELFRQDRMGQAQASANAGGYEGEFYGLRPWETGDSRRWIHWRTTARLGELSVRQFEQRQRRQKCILVELFDSGAPEVEQHVELVISCLATLTSRAVSQGRDKLAIATIGKQTRVFTSVQSSVMVHNLLDYLAVVESSKEPDLLSGFRGLTIPLMSSPHLLVLSTRANQSEHLKNDLSSKISQRVLDRVQIRWLDVSQGDLEPYFQWT